MGDNEERNDVCLRKSVLEPSSDIDYGRWEKGDIVYTDPNKPTFNSSNIYWLYVTIADPANGGCIDYTKKIKMIEVL